MGQELALYQAQPIALSPERKLELATIQVRYSTSRLQALELAKKLIGHYPNARPPDGEGYVNGLADIFEHYPLGVIEECCDVFYGIAAGKDWPPAPAEVIRWCDNKFGACRNVIRRGLPATEKHFDDEHCATMRNRLQQLMHNIFKPERQQQESAE